MHHRQSFANPRISMGVMIHMAGMVASILSADKMKDPAARWAAIAAFGIATGIGESIWRDDIDRERDENNQLQRSLHSKRYSRNGQTF